jgi:hypothetical protein
MYLIRCMDETWYVFDTVGPVGLWIGFEHAKPSVTDNRLDDIGLVGTEENHP